VLWFVLREAGGLAAAGLLISVPIALAATRLVRAFLFNVTPNDPVTLIVAAAVLVCAALIAAYGPACRAATTSPMTALRTE
jgi:ABC-type antimicrobial peptide transport system permease subunit